MENEDYFQSQSRPSEFSSVLHGNEAFVKKLLSRSSTSSRQSVRRDIYYCEEHAVMIPFLWEIHPGIPKDPPNEDSKSFLSLQNENPNSSTPSMSSSELKHSTLNQKRPSSSKSIPASCFLIKSKKPGNDESRKFSHSDESSGSDGHGFFSSSPCASKSSSSTSARASSSSSKALATSLPMSSKLRILVKRLLRRLF